MGKFDIDQIPSLLRDVSDAITEVMDKEEDQLSSRLAELKKQSRLEERRAELELVKDSYSKRKQLTKEIKKLELEDDLARTRKVAEEAATLKERNEKKQEIRRKENAAKWADKVSSIYTAGLDKLHAGISGAAKTYAGFVDQIQTRLLGANETYSSITAKISASFGASPFFQMQRVMQEVSKAVNTGISFNIEARAAMSVLSEKVANTFNAFDSTLLRLVRVQQADSTQARLGMESFLNEFLNQQYKDTSYLSGLSKQVSANLLEAQSLMGRDSATEFEFAIQKWLGSMSSVGVSDTLVTQLSRGLGMLGSGDVTGLSGDTSLEQLLVAAANRGGVSYGDMLTGDVSIENIDSLMRGLHSLVSEISSSENVVALQQYARVFGMTVSDIRSMLNITSDGMEEISKDMRGYGELVQRVVKETSFDKLYSRTGGATIGDNLFQNFIGGAGQKIGATPASYLAWEVADVMSGLLKGIQTGVSMSPFGVGTTLDFSVGDILKAATVSAGVMGGISSMMSGLNSRSGVDLEKLMGGEGGDSSAWKPGRNVVSRGGGKGGVSSMMAEGTVTSHTMQVSDFSESALVASSNAATQKATAQHTDVDFDAEKEKMEQTAKTMEEIGDNVAFIVQMLNESGIVVRGGADWTTPDRPAYSMSGMNMDAVLGGRR